MDRTEWIRTQVGDVMIERMRQVYEAAHAAYVQEFGDDSDFSPIFDLAVFGDSR